MYARRTRCSVMVLLLGSVATAGVALGGPAEDAFFKAYFVEHAVGDWETAATLYEEVLDIRGADRDLRSEARARLAGCREELAAADFASLMPPDTLAYVELNRPGDRLGELLDKLGLLARADEVFQEGRRRVAISPVLVKEVLGIRGAAVAITGFDPSTETPSGVLVLHPGDVEIIRALIETGLPAGGEAIEPIGGFPTYNVEGEFFVTLTSKLVIASNERARIEGVVERLGGRKNSSLAENPALKDLINNRDDSLLLFFVNAKPLLPMINAMIMEEARNDPGVAAMQSLLDLDSLNSLTGRIGLGGEGIALELALRLDEGHRNLVYNFLRTPAINPETLKCVPSGAAAVLAGALNDPVSRYRAVSSRPADTPPVVTALDFGREIFGNITSVAAFALPAEEGASPGGPPIPDIGIAITVIDPAMSEALWIQILGVANLATGMNTVEGESSKVSGVKVRTYKLPENITLHFAISGNDLLITSTRSAMARTLDAKKRGQSILDDDGFRPALARLGPDSTKALLVHAGRCAKIAERFMPPGDLEEAAPILAMLSNTVASVTVEHSGEMLRLSTLVSGVPDISDLVSKVLTEETRGHSGHHRSSHAARPMRRIQKVKPAVEEPSDQPDDERVDLGRLRAKFDKLATGRKNRRKALEVAKAILEQTGDDADALNTDAWRLLTEEKYRGAFDDLALKMSRRSNKLSDFSNWMYLDTLALASFKTGDAEAAVKLAKKAIERCDGCWGLDDMKKAMARFKAAASD